MLVIKMIITSFSNCLTNLFSKKKKEKAIEHPAD